MNSITAMTVAAPKIAFTAPSHRSAWGMSVMTAAPRIGPQVKRVPPTMTVVRMLTDSPRSKLCGPMKPM